MPFPFRNVCRLGAWVAESVKCPTLEFGLGHDLRVVRSRALCWALCWAWSLLKILSVCLSASVPSLFVLLRALSLSQKKEGFVG